MIVLAAFVVTIPVLHWVDRRELAALERREHRRAGSEQDVRAPLEPGPPRRVRRVGLGAFFASVASESRLATTQAPATASTEP
ncbi:MAG: hypothetical protein KatS3mg012_1512 [Gaiellaceae bacterium]|nr:MAG: hypothetical protein KatS3mg012_1512 [Gaiellaceae bacterium]